MRVLENQFEAAVPARETSGSVRLVFDSGPGPVTDGVGGAVVSRQFAYETSDYYIDLRLEPHRQTAGGLVIGKISHRGTASQQPAENLGVCLLNGQSAVVAAFTSRAGEFQVEFEDAHCLCISISRDELDEVVFPLFGIQANPQNKTWLQRLLLRRTA
jgi:hypothetical protein